MLKFDPILSEHFPELLPTESELRAASALLSTRLQLRQPFLDIVRIAGDSDAALLRFLWQARQDGDREEAAAKGALRYIEKCLEARSILNLDVVLVQPPFDTSFVSLFLTVIPLSYHGVNKNGNPVLIVRYGSVDTTLLADLWKRGEAFERGGLNGAALCYLRCQEYLTRVVMPEESKKQSKTVDRILMIIDVKGLGMAHWSNEFKSFAQQSSKYMATLYPETLYRTIVTNSPWLVAKLIWPFGRQFMHPVTQKKFSFVAEADTLNALKEEMADVEIPPYLGGSCNCSECVAGELRGGSLDVWEKARREGNLPTEWRQTSVSQGTYLMGRAAQGDEAGTSAHGQSVTKAAAQSQTEEISGRLQTEGGELNDKSSGPFLCCCRSASGKDIDTSSAVGIVPSQESSVDQATKVTPDITGVIDEPAKDESKMITAMVVDEPVKDQSKMLDPGEHIVKANGKKVRQWYQQRSWVIPVVVVAVGLLLHARYNRIGNTDQPQ